MKKRFTRVLVLFLSIIMLLAAVPMEGSQANAANFDWESISDGCYFTTTQDSYIVNMTYSYTGDTPMYFGVVLNGDGIKSEYQNEYRLVQIGGDSHYNTNPFKVKFFFPRYIFKPGLNKSFNLEFIATNSIDIFDESKRLAVNIWGDYFHTGVYSPKHLLMCDKEVIEV